MNRSLLIICLATHLVAWIGINVHGEEPGPDFKSGAVTDANKAEIVLFNNGYRDATAGSDLGVYSLANDFQVSFSAAATGASFDMADTNGFPANWDGVLRWWIRADNGGLPGAVLAKGVGVDVGWSLQITPQTWSVYLVSFNFGQSISITAGTRYWLALHMNRTWTYHVGLVWLWTPTGYYSPAADDQLGLDDWDTLVGVEHAFSVFASTEVTYIFTDGFELADTSVWSSTIP